MWEAGRYRNDLQEMSWSSVLRRVSSQEYFMCLSRWGDPTPTRYIPSTLCKWRPLQLKTCSSSIRHTTFRFCWYMYWSEWPQCRWRKCWRHGKVITVKVAAATASILLGVQVGAGRAGEERLSWGGEAEEPGTAGSWSFLRKGNCLLKLLVEVLKSCSLHRGNL